MPHKDKKTHCEYMKRYLANPINSAKNREIQKRRYWKNRIIDYCDMNKIAYLKEELDKMTSEQLKNKFKEIERNVETPFMREKREGVKS